MARKALVTHGSGAGRPVFRSEMQIMSNVIRLSPKILMFALALSTAAALGKPVWGQQYPAQGTGLVEDWSDHHLIFSNPGTERDAILNGTHEKWLRVVNDPRYVMQQYKRKSQNHGRTSLSPGQHRDWAVSLGTGGVAQNMFPAKFTFNTDETLTSASCTNDFVVYGLDVAGTTGGQANLVALNELYTGAGDDGYCSGYATAQPYWAYNATTHGGTVTTSPVLSENGEDIMYIESHLDGATSASYLHILVWHSGDDGTPTDSKAPTNTETHISACPANASCIITVALGSGTDHTITYSSPFYDYTNDILYVGDDDGVLYKVTPVLTGTTAPVVTTLTVDSGSPLTSPVYDSNSGNVFVGGSYYLYAVKASTLAFATNEDLQIGYSGTCTTPNNVLYAGPIVDSTNGWVYEYVTDGAAGNEDDTDTEVVQAHTTGANSPSGTSWTAAVTATVGIGDYQCISAGLFPTWPPAFDNNYYEGTVTDGHMWVCGRSSTLDDSEAQLWEIPTSGTNGELLGGTSGAGTAITGIINTSTAHAECSPMTEIYNGTTDYLFVGEGLWDSFADLYGMTISAAGTATALSGSDVPYPYSTTTGSAADPGPGTGGTSGIVVDNVSSEAQASSIYFTTLAPTTTAGEPCGTATGVYCAIKLTQAGLK